MHIILLTILISKTNNQYLFLVPKEAYKTSLIVIVIISYSLFNARLSVVKTDNGKLKQQLIALKAAKSKKEEKTIDTTEPPKKRELKRDHRPIPGNKNAILM